MSDVTFSAEEEAILNDRTPEAPAAAPPTPEPAPEPPPAAEAPKTEPEPAKADPEPAKEPKGQPNGVYPQLRRAERELAELRSELNALKSGQQPQQTAPAIPDPEKDLAGHVLARQNQSEQAIRAMLQNQQQQTFMQQIATEYNRDLTQAARTTPEVLEARGHWLNTMEAFARAANPRLTDAQIDKFVTQRELELVNGALQDQESPAQRMLATAKAIGWAPKAKEVPRAPDGKFAAPPPTLSDVAADVKRIAAAQAQATSPVAGLGAAPASELTLETLAAMSDDDLANLSPAKWQKAMGG